MRITNEMMNNTSLSNINKNKTYLDKLNTQMTSQKKITRPSDDPIIAIRALRLRNSVSEVTQYYSNNVPDALEWVSATTDALSSTSTIISSMRAQFVEGSNGPETTEDRAAILKELQGLRDQIYDDGNADYAGRTLFTGYRTGVDLTFGKATTQDYEDITEGFNGSSIENLTYVSGKVTTTEASTGTGTTTEQTVTSNTLSRIRLAYEDLAEVDGTQTSLTYRIANSATAAKTAAGFDVTTPSGTVSLTKQTDGTYTAAPATASATVNEDGTITVRDADNNVVNMSGSGKVQTSYQEKSITIDVVSLSGGSDAAYLHASTGNSTLIPETGEIILNTADAATLGKLQDINGVSTIEIKYDKSDWAQDDLRPEHYFDCVDTSGDTDIVYDSHNQEICYDVSGNQSMRVNTFASEVYTHDIGRDVDEAISSLQEVNAAQAKVDSLTKLQSSGQDVSDLLEAANKELTLVKDKSQKFFEGKLTTFQGYIDRTTLASTNAGTRTSRLNLVKNRLSDLKTSVSELQKNNENAEITDVAIEVSSAELVYNAALLATGKISQQSLLNYL